MKTILIPLTALLLNASAFAAPAVLEETVFWPSFKGGYFLYRIPALAVTAQGTVLAFCEGRKTSGSDQGDIDVIMKRSTDGGRTWSPHKIVYEEGGDAKIGIGNPCVIADNVRQKVWLAFCRDNKAVLVTSSADDGLTWAEPRDISATVVKPEWNWVATGPGVGIALEHGRHKGRLIIPCNHRLKGPDKKAGFNSHAMFSDDDGRSWQISGAAGMGGSECQVIERDDDSLLLNARMMNSYEGFRGAATSADGGASWSPLAQERQLPCSQCQGSMVRFVDKDRPGSSITLFANPHPPEGGVTTPATSRVRLTIRLSYDEGRTWPVAKVLHAGPAAYSSLARLPDGTILCLYEGGREHRNEGPILARFPLEWLTEGKDSSK